MIGVRLFLKRNQILGCFTPTKRFYIVEMLFYLNSEDYSALACNKDQTSRSALFLNKQIDDRLSN